MVDKRYGIPFVAALVLNLAYWGVVGDWFGHIKPPETPKKRLGYQSRYGAARTSSREERA